MAKINRNFAKGRMNTDIDPRFLPDGEYLSADNLRFNSATSHADGSVTNANGNLKLTALSFNGTSISPDATCIGAAADSSNERLFWCVHDPSFGVGAVGKLDLILSYNTITLATTYHVISMDAGSGAKTTLNFNPDYLMNSMDLVENLLFISDDYNEPRCIDVNKSYGSPVLNIDEPTLYEDILVIKKPPYTSPTFDLLKIGDDMNYIEDRFISFAYRYRYANNQYSATSQFSIIAFEPDNFDFAIESMLNEGMQNKFNAVSLKFNSGGPLVVGVDILFKDASDSTIKVIEKLNKKDKSYLDDTEYSYLFDNSKIFTILLDSEILRLYDNVPIQAKAQTIMGNRLVYGNYKDGFDLKASDNSDVKIDFEAKLKSEDLDITNLTVTESIANYTVHGAIDVTDGVIRFDLTDLNPSASVNLLKSGSSINFNIELLHDQYSGTVAFPTVTNSLNISFVFNLNRDYTSVYQLASSTEFRDKIGTAANILPVYHATDPTSCSGVTLTDMFNCAVPDISGYTKYASGLSAEGQPIEIFTSPYSKAIALMFPAMKYVADPLSPTVNYLWDYFKIYSANGQHNAAGVNRSLHSNRDEDIAIVYMDDFSRATIPLVSDRNTVHIPCSKSDTKNYIEVSIPPSQKPPEWATRYKFFIKSDKEGYETIFTNVFFQKVATQDIYFLLEGENAKKVEEGDRYVVKADTNGALDNYVVATVLEKKAQASGFITTTSGEVPPAGVYMKMIPDNFSVDINTSAAFNYVDTDTAANKDVYLEIELLCGQFSGPTAVDIPVPARTRVVLKFNYERKGGGIFDSGCEQRKYVYSRTFISTADYVNMYDWFVGDGIAGTIDSGTKTVGGSGCSMDNVFIPGIQTSKLSKDLCTNKWYFYRDTLGNPLKLIITGTRACSSNSNKIVNGTGMLSVYPSDGALAFETIAKDSLPDVFFESSESFPIVNGFHVGNEQTQTPSAPAIIRTDFFNCFSFGNGVESYKILDSIVGRTFGIGNRVMSISAEDYKRIHRYADLTYSGVYNDETNVNKLNEFNGGLLNFAPLEDSFGFIQKIDGRRSDILVLQEDKISYVPAGKHLLSDAAGGGALTSVPEVLGKQIARIEEYGISHNPESYVKRGGSRFFTDAKRGAVIQMKGNDTQAESLEVVSTTGNFKTWFKNLFNQGFRTNQMIGGYDPYFDEYALFPSNRKLPNEIPCSSCNDTRSFSDRDGNTVQYCIDAGPYQGMTRITWSITSIIGTFTLNATYNGITYTSGPVTTSGFIDVPKSLVAETEIKIEVLTSGSCDFDIHTACPDVARIKVKWIVVSSKSEAGQAVTPGLSYDTGETLSGLSTDRVELSVSDYNPNVSLFKEYEGFLGDGSIPSAEAEVTLLIQKNTNDSFVFDFDSNNFMTYVSSTDYENNPTDINFLLDNATILSEPSDEDGYIYTNFSMPEVVNGDTLYLIWDLRKKSSIGLAFSNVDAADACCGFVCSETHSEYTVSSAHDSIVYFNYTNTLDVLTQDTIAPGEQKVVCSSTTPDTEGTFSDVTIELTNCKCSS